MNMDTTYPFDFSVVMAVYNVEPFLRESVDTLIHQDFGFDRIQLILVDDGSTDASGLICDEYQMQYPRNVLVIHKENGGVASARNAGLQYATGCFLNFMDSDDKFSLSTFSRVFDFFVKHEEETDIVTIPLHFFDAQHGEHWQNGKFKAGSRIIDLYHDYRAPIMFVNASFFAARAKPRISFDPHLVCGEDIKVLLTILAEKMTLGVVNTCMYLYRRRSRGEASLIQTAKKKYGWYFDYFTYLIDWATDACYKRFGYLPAFFQYELLCDLQWRFREDYDMEGILSKEEIALYRQRLSHTLKRFDDSYILEQTMPFHEHKLLMLKYKYDRAPTFTPRDHDVFVHYGNTALTSVANQYSMIEFIDLGKQSLRIEGYTKFAGISADEPLDVYVAIDEKRYLCETYSRNAVCEYRFKDELFFRGIPFRVTIPLSSDITTSKIFLDLKYRNTFIRKRNIRYGKFSPISTKYAHSYNAANGWMIQAKMDCILLSRCDAEKRRKQEKQFLTELWKKNQKGARKAVLARLFHFALSKILRGRELWLISDRPQKAGDNGEAFFEYVARQNSSGILPYFVIMKDSPDYERIKEMGRVAPYMSWKHKMLHLLASKIISSQADDLVINPFFEYKEPYRDLLQKQRFVFLQHGISENDISYWFNRFRTNMKGFVCAAYKEQQSILQNPYFYTQNEVWLTGFPRFDKLYHDEKNQIVIMPTWRAYLVQNDRTTGIRRVKADFEKSAYYAMYSELITNDRLKAAAERYGYRILYVCHPNMMDSKRFFEIPGGCAIDSGTPYAQLFAESNLLITDYSSVAFDFAYLRKPVLYYQADIEEFYSGGHTAKKGYFDYETDGFGEVEYNVQSLVDRMIEYMQHGCPLKKRYRKRIDNFYAFSDKNNCQRVYEKIRRLESGE